MMSERSVSDVDEELKLIKKSLIHQLQHTNILFINLNEDYMRVERLRMERESILINSF